jgi:hypothetical protein
MMLAVRPWLSPARAGLDRLAGRAYNRVLPSGAAGRVGGR